MKKHLLFTVALLALVSACSETSVRNKRRVDFKDRCSVIKTGEKQYVIDDNTTNVLEFLQYIHTDTLQRFSFLNKHSNSIYLYNAADGSYLDSISIAYEGSNGVGEVQGYYYHNDDSIFLYVYGLGKVFLADHNGQVNDSYWLYDVDKISKDTFFLWEVPFMGTMLPMFYHNGKLLLNSCYGVDTSAEKVDNNYCNLCYDIKLDSVHFDMPAPKMYRKFAWGDMFTYRYPSAAMDFEGNVLFSFAADHNLWRYNPTTCQRDSFYAGSKEIEEIVPLETKKKFIPDPVPDQLLEDWYFSQPSYEGIFSDPYKQLYYRIARLPNTVTHYANGTSCKPVVVVVLDKDFNYIGEEHLPEGVAYNPMNSYVSPEGLHINIMNLNDEDHITFYTYNTKF